MNMKLPTCILRAVAVATTILLTVQTGLAADPTATNYSARQCEGSLTPYPVSIKTVDIPDSLTIVYINHVGRHGSRFPASGASCFKLREALLRADSISTITPLGRRLLAITNEVIAQSNGRWGALDSLGMAEQRAIATRMFENYPQLFREGCLVNARSSYSPRAMMSMFSFVHQIDRMNNRVEFTTSTGRVNSKLLRPFDIDNDYLEFRKNNVWEPPYQEYFENNCPLTAISRALGRDYPYGDSDNARDLAITEYYVLAGLSAMSMPCDMNEFFTPAEYNALWSCFNLRQYLQRTASTVSSVPADIAADLVLDLIQTTDNAIEGSNPASADLRFGHAETLMPLLSLLRLPGCYYVTNYFDTVGLHWRDFEVVPMAANLQIALFKAKKSGRYYVRFDVNEKPVKLPGASTSLYVPWGEARAYMMRCVPLYAQ